MLAPPLALMVMLLLKGNVSNVNVLLVNGLLLQFAFLPPRRHIKAGRA